MPRDEEATAMLENLLGQGWTKPGLADQIGVDLKTIYRWIKGESAPRRRDILALKYLCEGIEAPH